MSRSGHQKTADPGGFIHLTFDNDGILFYWGSKLGDQGKRFLNSDGSIETRVQEQFNNSLHSLVMLHSKKK